MKVSFQIARNTLTSWGCSILNGVLGWILVPLYLAHLGREGYGLIGLVSAIVTYTFLADLGLRDALARQLAAEAAFKDRHAFNRLVNSALVFYFILSLVIGLCFVFLGEKIAHLFAVSSVCLGDAVFLLRWFAPLAMLLTFVGSVYGATLASENRFDRLNLINSAIYAVRALSLVVVLTATETGLRGWACVTLLTEVVRIAWLWRASKRLRPDLRMNPCMFRPAVLLSLGSLGLYSFAAQFANLLSAQSDPFVLSFYFGPTILVLYTPAAQLLNATRPFVYAIAAQLCPVATNYHVLNSPEELVKVLTAGTKYQLLLGAGALAVTIGFSVSIMRVWLGNKLGNDCSMAATVLIALAFAELIAFCGGTQWPVLLAMRRIRVYLQVAVPLGFFYVGSSIILAGHTRLGLWSVLIPNLVFSTLERIFFTIYTARQCRISPIEYWKLSYFRAFIVFGVLLVFCIALQRSFEPTTYYGLALCTATALGIWMALCWFIGLSVDERSGLTAILQRCCHSIGVGRLTRPIDEVGS